jgi:alkylhydroperoxidase family enzyme
LTEDLVEQIEADYAASELPTRYKLAVEYADVLIGYPAGITDDLKERLAAEFSPAEIVELTATITIASAFSKAAIAWGPPPQIPIMETPTPGPGRSVTEL